MEKNREGKVKWRISIDWREARNMMVRKKEMSDVEEKKKERQKKCWLLDTSRVP